MQSKALVNEAVDVFLEFHCSLYDPTDVGSLISGPSALSESSFYVWKFPVHVLLEPSLKDFEHYLASMWNEHNGTVVGEGNGTPLQYSCLENPVDRGAW